MLYAVSYGTYPPANPYKTTQIAAPTMYLRGHWPEQFDHSALLTGSTYKQPPRAWSADNGFWFQVDLYKTHIFNFRIDCDVTCLMRETVLTETVCTQERHNLREPRKRRFIWHHLRQCRCQCPHSCWRHRLQCNEQWKRIIRWACGACQPQGQLATKRVEWKTLIAKIWRRACHCANQSDDFGASRNGRQPWFRLGCTLGFGGGRMVTKLVSG